MKTTTNKKQTVFRLTIILLTVLAISLNSCNLFHGVTGKIYALPTSFTDTLNAIKANLESKEQFVFYSSYNGNCFGPSLSGKALIKWTENNKSYCRTLFKDPEDKKVTDLTVECDIDRIFNEFRIKRLDTVTTFPKGYIRSEPSTSDYIMIKNNKLTYERSFQQMPFITSTDTAHILYSFIKNLME